MTFRVETEYPIAIDSPDHLYPWGTKNEIAPMKTSCKKSFLDFCLTTNSV